MAHNTVVSKHLVESLINFGFSDKEAKVYFTLLELELGTVSEIAKSTGLNRSSVYVVMDSLKKKGFVGISDDKTVRRYVAASPDLLLYSAGQRVKQQEIISEKIKSIVPELRALNKDTQKRPAVRIFEGKTGLREVYYDIFSVKPRELLTYANPANILRILPDFLTGHNTERIKAGIKMYAINPATKESTELLKYLPKGTPDEIVLIPKSKFKFTSDMGIYGDRVSLASPEDDIGIIIENKKIANMLRAGFWLAWEEAKRLNQEVFKRARKKSG